MMEYGSMGGSTQMNQVAILYPLIVGIAVIIVSILIHGFAVAAVVNFVRHGRGRDDFWNNLGMVAVVTLFALAAHLIEIATWAAVFLVVGEFAYSAGAFYHSAVNYTTLGYGDIVMSRGWRLLGPLEAADGMLMFGVTTAMIFAVVYARVMARHPDLRG
jgi:hypothetical protein